VSGIVFAPATRKRARARIALDGPSGSGKTWTALMLASNFGGPVAVVDTEHESASLYADEFSFDAVAPPGYDPAWLIKAFAAAGQAGYATVIVDSLSHFWSGADGMLEQVDRAAKRRGGGNNFAGWKEMRPVERNMIEAMLSYPGHVIVTMRSKTEYVVDDDERGKKVPRKVGLRPDQRDGIEFEFDIVGDLDLEHTLVITKTRCSALADAVIRHPDEGLAKRILDWLNAGAEPVASALDYRDRAIEPDATRERLLALLAEVTQRRMLGVEVVDDTGDTVTLEALIKAKGADAALRSPMSGRTQGRMFALFGELGMGGDDEEARQVRRVFCSGVLDPFEVTSVGALTEGQARRVVTALEERKRTGAEP
jgi:hypothetical protein